MLSVRLEWWTMFLLTVPPLLHIQLGHESLVFKGNNRSKCRQIGFLIKPSKSAEMLHELCIQWLVIVVHEAIALGWYSSERCSGLVWCILIAHRETSEALRQRTSWVHGGNFKLIEDGICLFCWKYPESGQTRHETCCRARRCGNTLCRFLYLSRL